MPHTRHRRAHILCRTIAALLAMGMLLHPPARAQEADARYTLAVRGVPLSVALERIVAETRLDLYYDPPLVAGKRTSCTRENARAEDLLRCVLKDTGLDFVRFSSGLYVLIPVSETSPLFGELSGIVVDADTGEPLPSAHVILAEARRGSTANDAGMFAFSRLMPGRYLVTATYIGYQEGAASVEVPPGGNTQAQLRLRVEPMLVAPIVVDGMQWRLPSSGLGLSAASQEDLVNQPGTGAPGVLPGLTALLGVRSNDATADIHVQGGETGEHRLRLDGAPVFLPLSFASFVGPFSPFAIGRITVHKAGFGATHGSQISGVIDIDQDVAAAGRQSVDFQVDPLSLNGRASVRHAGSGGMDVSAMSAVRYGLWDLYAPSSLVSLLKQWNTADPFLLTAFDRSTDHPLFQQVDSTAGDPSIGFVDVHLASRVRFGLLRSLHTSAYWGQSRLGSDVPDRPAAIIGDAGTSSLRDLFTWETGVAQSRYESIIGSRALASLQLRGSYYRVRHDYEVPRARPEAAGVSADASSASTADRPDDGNRIYEVGAEARLDVAVGNWQHVSLGTSVVRDGSRFTILGTQQYPIRHSSAGWRMTAYGEDEISLGHQLTVHAGGRLTYLPSHGTVYPEPRLALRLDRSAGPLGPWSFFVGTGMYRQFINQFDVSSRSPRALVSSTRFWLLADSTTQPPRATHLAGELLMRPSKLWSIRFEGYQKWQQHILTIDYASESDPGEESMSQDAFLRSSSGSVRGAGIQLQRKLGDGRAEARYEYTVARRVIPAFFEGKSLYAPWNQPHRLEFAVDLMPFRGLTILGRWRGIWGRTWAYRQAYYDFAGAFNELNEDNIPTRLGHIVRQFERHQLSQPDKHELAPLYQLDLSVAYALAMGPMRLQLRADVLNVTDRRNVAEWTMVYDEDAYFGEDDNGFLLRGDRPVLPRLVTLAARVSW